MWPRIRAAVMAWGRLSLGTAAGRSEKAQAQGQDGREAPAALLRHSRRRAPRRLT
jgi:hypothetical protein